jgi:preprotein translocase subunit YajC
MKTAQYFLFALCTFLTSNLAFAEEGGEPVAAKDQGFMQTLIMIGIAILFFYFILWRPEQKRRKAMDQQRSSLKKGDRVTAMGIIGTVLRVQEKEQTVILKMYDGSKIEVLKGAITDVAPGTEEDEKKAEKEERNDLKKEIDLKKE